MLAKEVKDFLLDMLGILNKNMEITLKVNIGATSLEKLDIWQQTDINSFSVGVQSINNKVLAFLNGHQSLIDVQWLIEHVSKKINNIFVDVIVGLSGKQRSLESVNW